jgi:hypothetical protein
MFTIEVSRCGYDDVALRENLGRRPIINGRIIVPRHARSSPDATA